MSTSSRIAVKMEYGKYKSIYCHWDGHIESLGAALLHWYEEEEKVIELIEKGDISSLDLGSGKIDDYRSQGDHWSKVRPIFSDNIEGLEALAKHCDFLYIFENEKWEARKFSFGDTVIVDFA